MWCAPCNSDSVLEYLVSRNAVRFLPHCIQYLLLFSGVTIGVQHNVTDDIFGQTFRSPRTPNYSVNARTYTLYIVYVCSDASVVLPDTLHQYNFSQFKCHIMYFVCLYQVLVNGSMVALISDSHLLTAFIPLVHCNAHVQLVLYCTAFIEHKGTALTTCL